MTATAQQSASKRHLLLASDRTDQSSELIKILSSVGAVEAMAT
ncbi:MAG: hypothetical protein V7634_4356, partial [Bradyrhizobium sp.]